MPNEKLAISVDELSEMLGCSRPLAYQLCHKTGFPAIHISERRIVIPVDALKRYLNEQAGIEV